jgi:hypothetical protein
VRCYALEDLMNIITLTTPIYDQHVWAIEEHTPEHTTLTATLPNNTTARIVRQGSEWAAQRQQRGLVTRQLTREACAELDAAMDLEASATTTLDLAETPAEAWAELAALETWALETPGVELRAFGAHHCGYAIGQAGRYCGTVYWRRGRWTSTRASAAAGSLLDLALVLLRAEQQDEDPSAVTIQR